MQLNDLARAKVNLTLRVLGRRPDGYHELDSLVVFADIGDDLELEPADRLEIVAPGLAIPAGDNLMNRAANLFVQHFGPQPYRLTLTKRLPIAAGLGGGSADAAAVLRLLGRAHAASKRVAPTDVDAALAAIAAEIGSDVPACLFNRACRMRGRGELIVALADRSPVPAVLVNTGDPVPANKTAAIFRALAAPPFDAARPEPASVDPHNDLETPALAVMPAVADALAALRATAGLTAARMSGAGPTCFGLYETAEAASAAAQAISRNHPTWWVHATTLS